MIKPIIYKIFEISMLLVCMMVPGTAHGVKSFPVEEDIYFSAPANAQKSIASLNNPNVLTVLFGFDPYAPNLLDEYLPDGYITVNGEYDVTELVLKIFFDPLIENDHLNTLIIDLSPFLKNPTSKNMVHIKMLIEKMFSHFSKYNRMIEIGFKFKYSGNAKEFIDQLFSYTIVLTRIHSLKLESGYEDFLTQKKYQNYLKNLKYLDLQNNIIGAEKEKFNFFLKNLNQFKKLQVLNLKNNAIGSADGNLVQLLIPVLNMSELIYLNLENNLVGSFKDDTDKFKKSLPIKRLVVNLGYN